MTKVQVNVKVNIFRQISAHGTYRRTYPIIIICFNEVRTRSGNREDERMKKKRRRKNDKMNKKGRVFSVEKKTKDN